MDTPHQPEKVPTLLALLGVVPLALIAMLPPQLFASMNLFGFLYLTLIYCFLGGTQWGMALDKENQDDWLFYLSMIPVIVSFIAIYLYSILTVIHISLWGVLIVALIWQCTFDCHLVKQDLLPLWYRKLRITSTYVLVFFAIICLVRILLSR